MNQTVKIGKNLSFANKKYDYVKSFELSDTILPACYIVCRIDGKGFHKFTDLHEFQKPNDEKALELMNFCAYNVMKTFTDIIFAYGQSDEYSFVFARDTDYVNRRACKLASHVCSLFTSAYTYFWGHFFKTKALKVLPVFDSRIVAYPNTRILWDYLRWRQVDCHVNNLYNTVFWALVQEGGLSLSQAQKRLEGTLSNDKNEILFSQFHRNYNNERQIYKKGSLLVKQTDLDQKYFQSITTGELAKERGNGKDKTFDFYEISDFQTNSNGIINPTTNDHIPYLCLHIDLIKGNFFGANSNLYKNHDL